MKTPKYVTCALVIAGLLCTASPAQSQGAYALSGDFVTPAGAVIHGTIVIRGGLIEQIGTDISLPSGMKAVETDGVIFPGLIDLHNHLVWNVFPRWPLPKKVGDRYDWQALPSYASDLKDPEGKMIQRDFGCRMEEYAEVKALVGGATSVTGSFSFTDAEPQRNACDRGLARNLDFISGFYTQDINKEPLRYEVFPFEMSLKKAQDIRQGLQSADIKALLIHVAEGKDASAAREFNMLKAQGFLVKGVSVIHGVALTAHDFQEMADAKVGLVWSPRSNFELYGKTTNIRAAKAAGVMIALAPDWSPSGSSGLLDEMRYVYRWNQRQTPPVFQDQEFLDLVTANPAKLAGIGDFTGSLQPHLAADLIVLPRHGSSPIKSLLDSRPGSVKLVIVGGRPLLGDEKLMRLLSQTTDLDSFSICGHNKLVDLREDPKVPRWDLLTKQLNEELATYGSSLAPVAECPSKTTK